MPDQDRILAPGPDARTFRTPQGTLLVLPPGWDVLMPGDAGLTRRVKILGPTWTVQEKKGRKTFSRGVWAPRARIEAARAAIERERAEPAYEKRKEADAQRRARVQTAYETSFEESVLDFLAFDGRYATLAATLAVRVAAHATPVGSGTVARTKRIPIEERAEAAVIAWMRHQTTAYDEMDIARVKGARREVRRELAARSQRLLNGYRAGRPVDAATCPLQRALALEGHGTPPKALTSTSLDG